MHINITHGGKQYSWAATYPRTIVIRETDSARLIAARRATEPRTGLGALRAILRAIEAGDE